MTPSAATVQWGCRVVRVVPGSLVTNKVWYLNSHTPDKFNIPIHTSVCRGIDLPSVRDRPRVSITETGGGHWNAFEKEHTVCSHEYCVIHTSAHTQHPPICELLRLDISMQTRPCQRWLPRHPSSSSLDRPPRKAASSRPLSISHTGVSVRQLSGRTREAPREISSPLFLSLSSPLILSVA